MNVPDIPRRLGPWPEKPRIVRLDGRELAFGEVAHLLPDRVAVAYRVRAGSRRRERVLIRVGPAVYAGTVNRRRPVRPGPTVYVVAEFTEIPE